MTSGTAHPPVGGLVRLVPRSLAVLLALGGCFWGLLLSPWLFRGGVSPLALAVFGPGYLLTVAYIVRSVSTPSVRIRTLTWLGSVFVQGAWLAWDLWGISQAIVAGRSMPPVLPTAWWIFATGASAIALFAEWPGSVDLRLPRSPAGSLGQSPFAR
jgi:hypothetical protein